MLDAAAANPFVSAALALLVGAAVVVLLVWLADRRQKRRARERAQQDRAAHEAAELERLRRLPLPNGGVEVPTEDVEPAQDYPGGKVMLVVNGTFAANVVLFVLKLLHDSGLAGFVGSILLVELNESTKTQYLTI
ncbi:MAG TPA: hypothetical protein VGW38_26640 [Chloroflexota bacterium]|nr:hypothetical protein [Chloroflexota bacterium]